MTVTTEHGLPVPAALSRDDRKRVLFGADPYFRQGWADALRVLGPDAAARLHDVALLLLKPDAVARRHLDTTLDWVAARGGAVLSTARGTLSPHGIRAMWQYQMNAASIDRLELADLALADRPGLVLLVRLPPDEVPASVRFSAWKGPADPRRRTPDDLRSHLRGGNFLLSFVHAADARSQARAVEAEEPFHDLELATSLAALAAATPEGPRAADFRACLAAVGAGHPADWRELWRAADEAGVPPTRWDHAVVGSHLMQHTELGVAQILGSAARTLWQGDPP